MTDKRNIFGHSSVAKPTGMPNNERLNQMANMLRDDPEAELPQETQQDTAPMDLEQLIFLGRIEDTKSVAGFTFDMQTLTGKEQNDVWLSVSFLNNETKFFVIKVAFLARAITAVNGRRLDVLYKGKDFRDITPEQRSVRVVEAWQQPLIDELYEFYSEMVERSRKVIKPEDISK
jgi:hypothetical protein